MNDDEEDTTQDNSDDGADAGNFDSPMNHIDRHFVDIGVSVGSNGGTVDSVSTEVVNVD